MAVLPLPARFLCLLAAVLADPSPGRVPKVYNALITSNQNLEPSKAYPVYQPVLHDAFAFPYQPAVFYGDFPIGNGIQPAAPAQPKGPSSPPQPPAPPQAPAEDNPPATASPPPSPEPSAAAPEDKPTPAPPLPPNTQSPIPLNEFGLPSQVLPLGRFDPAYNGFTHIGHPFTYTYPNFRFYDPYDPFSFSPYAGLPPLYRPLGNVLEPVPVAAVGKAPPQARPEPSGEQSPQNPPPEPNDLNVLNYASKDPAIPNVPPPPLPDGGLKSDNSE